jgi:hypothetical protein
MVYDKDQHRILSVKKLTAWLRKRGGNSSNDYITSPAETNV